MLWVHTNKVLDADLLSSSNQVGYGVAALKDPSPAIRLKFAGQDDEYLVIDMLTAAKIKGFCLFGHNLTEDAVITLEANTSDAWVTPAFSRTITWRDAIAETFAEQEYRFWRLVLDDPTNPDPIEIGVVYLGQVTEVAHLSLDSEIPVEWNGFSTITPSGQAYGFTKYSVYAPAFNLAYLSEAKRKELAAVHASHGRHQPFAMLVWEDSLDVLHPLYVVFTMDQLKATRLAEGGLGYVSAFSCREVL